MVQPATWVQLLVPQLPSWRGQGELEKRDWGGGGKLRKGEGTEQKGRDSMSVCEGEHQEETL